MEGRFLRVIQAQFNKATSEPHAYLKFYMDEADIRIWYVLISGVDGDEGEYAGGQYIIKVIIPEDFPHVPPKFLLLTPQGLYQPDTNICISIGEYHQNSYRPVLGIFGFCVNIVSGLVGWKTLGDGIGIVHTTTDQKRRFAKASVAYNATYHAGIVAKIEESYLNYSGRWPKADEIKPNA